MNKQNLGILAAVSLAVLAVALGLFAVSEAGQVNDIEAMGVTNLSSLTLSDDLVVAGTSSITGAATQTGNMDIAGTLQFGADNVYGLGHAASGKQIVCGTTGVFTDSKTLAVGALSSIDGIVVTQITKQANSGLLLYVSAISGYTATIKSLENDYTIGTTGVNAYYCAVGNH